MAETMPADVEADPRAQSANVDGAAGVDPLPGRAPGREGGRESFGSSARRVLGGLVTRRGLISAGIVLGAALLYWYVCWMVSSTSIANSDAAGISLQGWDLWHHDPKLRHWITGDANFYTFETPLYAVVEMVMGLKATTLHVVAALTYTLVMLTTAWLVKGEERGMRAYARFALVAAFLAVPMFEGALTATLLNPPDHLGTAIFMLGGYLICDRAAGRKGATWCLFALLILGQLGDATVKYVGVIPIVLVCASRLLFARRLNAPELWLAIAAAASVPGEAILRAAMRTWGAYSMVAPKTKLAHPDRWLRQLHETFTSLLALFDVPLYHGIPRPPYWVIGAILGAIVLIAALYGGVRTLLRWPRAATADQLLTVGIPVYLAAFAFSTMVLPDSGSAYEFTGVVPMIVALGVRNLPLPSPRRLPLVVATAAVATVGVFATDFGPGVVTNQEQIAAWLKAHGLTYGIGGYWDAATVTVDSGTKAAVRAVVPISNHRYAVYAWVTKTTWYDPATNYANFFIADPGSPGLGEADVEAAFGDPQAVYQVGGRSILVYQTNLLANVIPARVPNY